MASDNLAREVATLVVDGLKKAGHVLVVKGKQESLLREIAQLVEPVLQRVLPRLLLRHEVRGEVTSTFGDEATDDAVEELVTAIRETLLDSEGIEDVFADDVTIDRVIFRTIQLSLTSVAARAEEEGDDEAQPPISVRLDTLGYVARTASKLSDGETLNEALERAAGSARAALDRFDAGTRTAFFAATEDDPDRRIEIEEAVEEALENLVDLGFVDLPSVTRDVAVAIPSDDREKRRLQSAIADVAQRTLTSGVLRGSHHLTRDGVRLSFTPLSQQDEKLIDALTQSFQRELEAALLATSPSPSATSSNEPRSGARQGEADAAPPTQRTRAVSSNANPAVAGSAARDSAAEAAARLLEATRALGAKKPARKAAKKAEATDEVPISSPAPAATPPTTKTPAAARPAAARTRAAKTPTSTDKPKARRAVPKKAS